MRHEKRGVERILLPDRDLTFPEFVLLKASAGTGKTHALSLRFAQFLLSEKIKRVSPAGLRNILAITFTKNAAREMKTRVLGWLKDCYFEDADRTREIGTVVTLAESELRRAAGDAVENILSDYSDFQVQTIDSFMAEVFKTSAVDLGHSPTFEIVLDNSELIRYAFSRYLRRVAPHSEEGRVFRSILDLIRSNAREDERFAWDPTPQVLKNLTALYAKMAVRERELKIESFEDCRAELRKAIAATGAELKSRIAACRLERSSRGHCYSKILPAIDEGRLVDLMAASFKTDPVKKPKGGRDDGDDYDEIIRLWQRLQGHVDALKSYYARDFFYPYLLAYRSFDATLDLIKRQRATVFIEDVNRQLLGYIEAGIVPDIYFRLGDRIFHYLIDEFQDTNRIQWQTLRPLVEESLSKTGSLFVVGDTKQAIYGFRDADFRIMKGLEEKVERFPSVDVQVRELETNYRSREAILDYVKAIFPDNEKLKDGDTAEAAARSGLDDFTQRVNPKFKESGYVEYRLIDKGKARRTEEDDEGDSKGSLDREERDAAEVQDRQYADALPEKDEIQKLMKELVGRGYAYSDIAVLTYRNETVVEVSSWLNEIGVRFIPYSSLDIRKRKIVGEIFALLRFLDSPPDDLSFSVFLLGEVFKKKLERDGRALEPGDWTGFLFDCQRRKDKPLYSAVRRAHPEVWARYLEPFFKTVGYYPLYDLVTLIYRVFDVFALFPGEEAALVKLLEVIKEFEGRGRNDLREFLEFTEEGEGEASDWTVDVPSDIDAVRVMSIHKAKGLGFPVVIFLAYGEKFLPADFYLGEEDEFVRVYKLNKDLAEADEALKSIYDEVRMRDDVERLNRLYVALTRASVELYVFGVKGARDKYPFDLLGDKPFASAPAKPPACPRPRPEVSTFAETARLRGPFELPPNRRETLNLEIIRRGEIAHRIMAELEFLKSGWEDEIGGIIRRMKPLGAEAELFDEVGRAVVRYFEGSPLDDDFREKEGRRILREFNFCDAAGAVYRMDRVVIDRDAVRIIDFKTGAEKNPERAAPWEREDREQVGAYVRIMSEIYPDKHVSGILAYIDKRTRETIE